MMALGALGLGDKSAHAEFDTVLGLCASHNGANLHKRLLKNF